MVTIPSGAAEIFRISIPDAVSSFQIPSDVTWFHIANVGANDMRWNYDTSGPSDFKTVKANTEMPIAVKTKPGENINTDGVSGDTTIEVMTWDE